MIELERGDLNFGASLLERMAMPILAPTVRETEGYCAGEGKKDPFTQLTPSSVRTHWPVHPATISMLRAISPRPFATT